MNVQYGWKCPECGAVMSPWQNCCINCSGQHNYTITCNQNKNSQLEIDGSKINITDGATKGKTNQGISWTYTNTTTTPTSITLQDYITTATNTSLDYKSLLSNNLNKLKNNI